MKGQSNCEVCNAVFIWYRGNNRSFPRFCSHKCRLKVGTGFRPGGQVRISEMTTEQKLERLKKSFEKHVIRKEGCWDWKGPITKNGYPVMSCRPEIGTDRGHRASWLIYKGEISEGLHVCHHCDNRKCTNPDHLWLGTHKQNNDDKMKKGRHVWTPPPIKFGSKNASSKLNEENVKEIKKMITAGYSNGFIAKKFGVTRSTILRIKTGQNWKHVEIQT